MIAQSEPAVAAAGISSVQDMLLNGGPFMIPIALASVVALAYVVERSLRTGDGRLGSARFGRDVVDALTREGPHAALARCEDERTPLARVLGAGLARAAHPLGEREKAVEDAGAREVRRLGASLRPLVVVATIAPLLGLLGTVWGMIEAFSSIALRDGLGEPELLAAGISQALVTTAAGLCVAIPTQAAVSWLRARIERFVRRTEDTYGELDAALVAHAVPQLAGAAS